MVRGINGRMAVTSKAFVKSGGYDEIKFNSGWSSEDKDFNWRPRKLGYRDVQIADFYLHGIPHNDKIALGRDAGCHREKCREARY
jgi:hypothetical protein